MKFNSIANVAKSVAVQMGVMSAFVAVDQTVRTFVKEKVKPFVRVNNNDQNR